MTNPTLHEHQARVDQAEKTLRDDLQRLTVWGRRFKHRASKGKVAVLVGGAVLLGIFAVRAAYRRQRRGPMPTAVRVKGPSLIGTAVRMAMLEAARIGAMRLAHRFYGQFEHERPRLPAARTPVASGIRHDEA
ncbi:MAG TPA: hypothetical protein VFU02_22140 [Polyangiaceae bacterium]|nr:hypothetical protein [Polyangiaceae bacterium]